MSLAISGLPGLVLLGSLRHRHRRLSYCLAFLCLLCLGIIFSACGTGGGGGGETPAGTYKIMVTGKSTSGSATLTHATQLTLVVE